jgi:hypothetical protein
VNLSLKFALVAYPEPAYRVAMRVGMNPNRLSRLVVGLSSPKNEEKEKLSELLGKPVLELFPKNELMETGNA